MSGLLVAGTHSDAGKSVVTAGICRWLHRRGVRVAPFKAQNMSNNSVVAIDASGRGGEIGRAQAMQAAACGLEPDVRFNPVLLKPGSEMSSQVVLLGEAVGTVTARSFPELRSRLSDTVFATLDELRQEYDLVVCEGAGSPAEINLREHDFVNLGLARYAGLPVVVVGDIDRGGVFASLYGTVALLAPQDQALLAGFVINKFRGHRELLAPGLDMLRELTGRPTFGVLPWHLDVWLDAEDSLAYGRTLGRPGPPVGTQWLRVAVVRLPHLSNATDAEALATEPGVSVRFTIEPAGLAEADLVVLPGSKSTVDDLAWLRRTGLADAVTGHAAAGRPVLGICGGYQMLGAAIHDDIESGRGTVRGLGLLPIEVTFAAAKTLARPAGTAFGAAAVSGYEIHHGVVSWRAPDLAPLIVGLDGAAEGAIAGGVFGTHWHGAFESDEFRRAFLAAAAKRADRDGFVVAPDTRFREVRERHLDLLGDLVEEHLDTEALWRLIERGPPAGLPIVPPGGVIVPPGGPASSRVGAESFADLPSHLPGGPAWSRAGVESYADLAARILVEPARLGGGSGTRLVAIDGPSGAGKTAFAERLATAIAAITGEETPVVRTDDLLSGWSDQLTFWPRLERWVLNPLRAGRAGRYRAYDWVRGEIGQEWHDVPPAGVVLLEGVSAARAEIRPELTLAVFVSAPADLRLARALERDGEGLGPYLDEWRTIENRHFAADATACAADLVVDGAPRVPHNPQMEYVRATDGWTAVAPV